MTENQSDNEKEMKETKVNAPLRHIVFEAKTGGVGYR